MSKRKSQAEPENETTRIVGLDKTMHELQASGVTPKRDPSKRSPVTTSSISLPVRTDPRRYVKEQELGKGGMGAVMLSRDVQIGRQVAVKVIHEHLRGDQVAEQRFLREARVQGQLEHPSVVPVYDLGLDPHGSAFFCMKRVQGITLDMILKDLKRGDALTDRLYSRRRLLTAFSAVCLAVDFAHRHGVLHRDLKPANLMFGDFGEVYVLDWGIAKILAEAEETSPTTSQRPAEQATELTSTTAFLGTLGYVSPEQATRRATADQPTSDVYSLGATLFEILALERLVPKAAPEAMLVASMEGSVGRPSERAPDRDIPPELDAICARATAVKPADRYQSARELHEALEEFLDGQRDEELRKELSQKHATRAQSVLQTTAADSPTVEARREAMQNIGRALALDPGNEDALSTFVELLSKPAAALPDDVQEQVRVANSDQMRWTARYAAACYLLTFLYLPLCLWAGIRTVAPAIFMFVCLALAAGVSFLVSRIERPRPTGPLVAMALSTMALASTAAFFGPLLVTFGLVAVNAAAYSVVFEQRERVITVLFAVVCTVVPLLLAQVGLLPSGYTFTSEGMTVHHGAIFLSAAPVYTMLAALSVGTIIMACFSVTRIREQLSQAQRQLYLYAWNVRQLVPTSSHASQVKRRRGPSDGSDPR